MSGQSANYGCRCRIMKQLFLITALVVSLVFAGSASAQELLPANSRDCSVEQACQNHVDSSLAQLKSILSLSSVRDVSACMDTLGSRERAKSLSENACVELVGSTVKETTQSWLASTTLCVNATQAATNSCSEAAVSAVLTSIQHGLVPVARPACQILLAQGASALSQLPVLIRLVARDILSEFSQELAHGNNAFSSDEAQQLEKDINLRLALAAVPLLGAQAKEQSDFVAGFSELLANITVTLAQHALPNSKRFANQTLFLVCSSLFPTCSCSGSGGNNTGNGSSTTENDTTTAIVILRPCHWSCVSNTELLRAVPSFVQDTSKLRSSAIFRLIQHVTRCADVDETQCLDLNCGDASAAADSPPVSMPSAIQYLCDMENDSEVYLAAQEQSQQVCIVSGQRCTYPLQSTTVPGHYVPEVRAQTEVLRALLGSVFPGQKTSRNESVLPCAAACTGLVYDRRKESFMRTLTVTAAAVTLAVEIFTIASFFLNRQRWNRCPTRLMLNISICYVFSCGAVLAQASVGWDRIACHEDGSLISDMPKSFERGSWRCLLTAVVLFYSLMAALLWWLCLCHGWLCTFQLLNQPNKAPTFTSKFSRREIIYHMICWGGSFLMMLGFISNQKIGGVPMYGVCITSNPDVWFYFLILPIIIVGPVGCPMLTSGLLAVRKMRSKMKVMDNCWNGGSKREKNAENLRQYQTKVGLVLLVSFVHLVVQATVGVCEYAMAQSGKAIVMEYISCMLLACDAQRHLCPSRPEFSAMPYSVLCLGIFSEGIVLCSWTATAHNWQAWVELVRSPLHTLRKGATTWRRPSVVAATWSVPSRPSEANGAGWEVNEAAAALRKARKCSPMDAATRTQSNITTTTMTLMHLSGAFTGSLNEADVESDVISDVASGCTVSPSCAHFAGSQRSADTVLT
ncbi:uncharacterized protein LOC135822991 [Sycon ciliatum]|uniref:uncharacterized protein LOC135822991 n=1 Tax=Sycon ciliatum TaxID=27933 RepID=UPI0031F6092D